MRLTQRIFSFNYYIGARSSDIIVKRQIRQIRRNSSNPWSRKKLDLRQFYRPYKVLLSVCAANCNRGTILAILKWKGEGEGNAQRNLGTPLVCAGRHRRLTMKCALPSLSAAYRGHTVRHHTRASRGPVDVEPRKQIKCNTCLEWENKLVRL